jgi:hypothetical protein
MLRPDTELPETLEPTGSELREACRALKGSVLRREVYALDGSDAENLPYSVTEQNYTIEPLQPRGDQRHAIFFAHDRESVDFHYERKCFQPENRMDPRVTHAITLEVDAYGNVLKSVAVGYGRRYDDANPLLSSEDKKKQTKRLLTLTENTYTNAVLEDDGYRTPLPCESRAYELLKFTPDAAQPHVTNLFRFAELQRKVALASDTSHDLLYEDIDAQGAVENAPYRSNAFVLCIAGMISRSFFPSGNFNHVP